MQQPANTTDEFPSYSVHSHTNNTKYITFARSSLSAVAGIAAGIIGLEGWFHGLAFYLICSMLLSFLIWSIKTRFNAKEYFVSSSALWTDQVLGSMFSYMLFWTLGYGLVHVYD